MKHQQEQAKTICDNFEKELDDTKKTYRASSGGGSASGGAGGSGGRPRANARATSRSDASAGGAGAGGGGGGGAAANQSFTVHDLRADDARLKNVKFRDGIANLTKELNLWDINGIKSTVRELKQTRADYATANIYGKVEHGTDIDTHVEIKENMDLSNLYSLKKLASGGGSASGGSVAAARGGQTNGQPAAQGDAAHPPASDAVQTTRRRLNAADATMFVPPAALRAGERKRIPSGPRRTHRRRLALLGETPARRRMRRLDQGNSYGTQRDRGEGE